MNAGPTQVLNMLSQYSVKIHISTGVKEEMPDRNRTRLNREGLRWLAAYYFSSIATFVVLFVSAGRLDWANAWIYVGLVSAYLITYTSVCARLNPEMLNSRGRFSKEGTKTFDKVYAVLYLPLGFSIVVVCGLDAARYQWSAMPLWLTVLGIVLILPSFAVATWAMAANPYFELSVRIQEDRDHRVITSGPYRYIRHPGYSAQILSLLTFPLILGSWWGLIPSAALVLIIIIRTSLEDRTLQKELPGYREYAGQTRYRLLPLVW
jgi:protein-S-isoprenylcysteine O-methyltransferase Ste14